MDQREDRRREFRNNVKLWRLGTRDPRCTRCGEDRPPALLRQADSISCYECRLNELGRSSSEYHHLAGRKNDPFSVPLPGNHHRCASDLQTDWPRKTLRNPHKSPLLRSAARLRGLKDLLFVNGEYLSRIASLLEQLQNLLKRATK